MKHFIFYMIIIVYSLPNCTSIYYSGSENNLKPKFTYLMRELVLQSISTVNRVDHFKNSYHKFPGFQIANIVYDIRRRYARIFRVYKFSLDDLTAYSPHTHHQHITHLEEVQRLAMEVFHLCEMLEEWEFRKLSTKSRKTKITTTTLSYMNFIGKYQRPKDKQNLRHGASEGKKHIPWKNEKRSKASTSKYNLRNDGGGFDSDQGF